MEGQNIVTVSVVTYKHKAEEIKDIISPFFTDNLVLKCFIIDNSPSDDLKLLSDLPKVEYIFNNANIGYGAGHNIAIQKAISLGAIYHLVLNPDVYIKSGELEKITGFMNLNPDIGNLMPKVFYPDGSLQYLCKLLPTPYDWIGRRFNPFKSLVNKRNMLFELRFTGYDKIMDVPYLSGCFMFLRTEALKKTGIFDENIFMYGEETDLCRRLIQGGYRTVYFPEASIIHKFQKGSHKSLRLTWIGMRSAIYYFNKWGWFFDSERKRINKETLLNLGYKTIAN